MVSPFRGRTVGEEIASTFVGLNPGVENDGNAWSAVLRTVFDSDLILASRRYPHTQFIIYRCAWSRYGRSELGFLE